MKKKNKLLNVQRKSGRKQQSESSVETQSAVGGVSAQQESGGWKYMLQDGLNSVRSVVDNDINVLQSSSYDPFGNLIDVMGFQQTPHGYTGEVTDPNELVYLRNRYYNPNIGTFVSQDPVEGSMSNPMSLNRYAYAQGDPINRRDPSGLIPIQAINSIAFSNPLAFANMMNSGICFAQTDPCFGYAGQAYIACSRGELPTTTPSPTQFPGTPSSLIYHVPCDFGPTFLYIRQGPSRLAPVVNIVNNPAGIEIQSLSTILGDLQLGGTGWVYSSALGGWVHDSNLTIGPSPCPSPPTIVTPTPPSSITPTPGPNDLDTISRVINCEADTLGVSLNGIAHAIYNRMTSGAAEWANYRTALSVIQNTGVDCYTNGRYNNFSRSPDSDLAAQWLLGMASPRPVEPLIDLQAYYWLGVPTFADIIDDEARREASFAHIVDNPDLYDYSACGVREDREVRLQRLRDRFVATDSSDRNLTTAYFSLSPLCE